MDDFTDSPSSGILTLICRPLLDTKWAITDVMVLLMILGGGGRHVKGNLTVSLFLWRKKIYVKH